MPETRRKVAVTAMEEEPSGEVIISNPENDPPAVPMDMEIERQKLRKRWELASVLNFLGVFEPVIRSNLRISGEEIESGLIAPNDFLAQLHIALLKGLMSSRQKLVDSGAWLAMLAKKLSMWWPWVAEGNFPLAVAKGKETTTYNALDPTSRLLILKALCEIRADQDDITSYVNDATKKGNDLSAFRKEELAGDADGTLYWYDGNSFTGHRLYKEVRTCEVKSKTKGKETKTGIHSQWETLATNLEEFQKVVNDFSSSQVGLEVIVSKAVQTHAIPALDKIQKKKLRLQKLKERQEMLLRGFQSSAVTRISARTRRPVSYRFEEYDKAINEAIEVTRVTRKRKNTEIESSEENNNKCGIRVEEEPAGGLCPTKSRGCNATDSDTASDKGKESEDDCSRSDASDGSNGCRNIPDSEDKAGNGNSETDQIEISEGWLVHKPKSSYCGEKVMTTATDGVPDDTNFTTKQRLRQRPTINTAMESLVVPDSEDEN